MTMQQPIPPFSDSHEHLLAELRWLETLLQAEIARTRSAPEVGRQELFRGVYISDREVDRLTRAEASPADSAAGRLRDQAGAQRAEIDARCLASAEQGVPLALCRVAALFSLTPFEARVVLAALAPEFDSKFGTLFAYLQDDVTRRRPSVDLAIRLFAEAASQRRDLLSAFSHQATLSRLRLLRGLHSPGSSDTTDPLPHRTMALDEPIVDMLLGSTGLDPRLAACAQAVVPRLALDELRWDPALRRQMLAMILHFAQTASSSDRRLIVHVHGPSGTGKRTLAAALCGELGVRLARIDVRELLTRFENVEDAIVVLLRQALVEQSAVFLDNFDAVTGDDDRMATHRRSIRRALKDLAWLVFVGTETAWQPGDLFHPHHYVAVELPAPDLVERRRLWEAASAAAPGAFAADIDWAELAVKFRFTPGKMHAAIDAASSRARLRDPEQATITADDLHRGLYTQSNQKLNSLARKLTARYCWSQLILPTDVVTQLRELCVHVRRRQTVFADWGFERALSLGKGLCALFCGPSGVGKTMAVEVIANELKLEVFRIDLSRVVSKYIGETEKNLSRVFEEAETSNAILFFDEADALFGKRSEVKDAHDRYANIEINYLLQRIEEFEGVVILASNLRKNIDEGFFRRMQFVVEFPFPDVTHRYGIWRQHFPAEAPAGEDIDFGFLSERFNLSGGNIKNIVVNAAFMAADDGRVIRMHHLMHATRREYEKIGRLCTEHEFGGVAAAIAGAAR